jgi:hypothetical protein
MDEECIICLEDCNDELYYFCKKCNYKFHKCCFGEWIKKCKELDNCYNKCLHCLEEKCMYKIKKIFCHYYNVKI